MAAAALAGALAAACGSASTSTPQPTPATYAARANAICGVAAQSQADLGPGPQFAQLTPANLAAATAYLARFIPILEDAGSRLHALGTSGASPAQVDALLGKLDAGIASLRAALTAAAAGDAVAFRAAFRSAVSTDEDANLVDDALGTTQCGQILTQPFRQRGAGASPPG